MSRAEKASNNYTYKNINELTYLRREKRTCHLLKLYLINTSDGDKIYPVLY